MNDYMIRATAADGQIRAFAANDKRGWWKPRRMPTIQARSRRLPWDVS